MAIRRTDDRRPLLRQFADLHPRDFDEHPVWVGCHLIDYDQPWYDETDEETFRPWSGPLPVDPSISLLLVRARVALPDGTKYIGFVTPATTRYIGESQPRVFIGEQLFTFWGGPFGIPDQMKHAFYAAIDRASEVFPLRVTADPSLVQGGYTIDVEGFYKKGNKGVEVER